MAIRHLVAALILAFIIGKTLRDPKFGVLAFVAVLLLDPSSLFWGFDQWRIPLVTSITLLIATLFHFHKRNKALGGGALFFWTFALTLFLLISTMYSVNVERSYRILLDYWIKTFVFCWLLMLWMKTEDDLRRLFSVIVGCFVLLSLRAIYRYGVGYPEIAGLAGTMQDRNDFALHLMLAVPFAYAMFRTAKSWEMRSVYLASIGLMVVCVMLTYSRMGFLLILSAGLMLLWSSQRKLKMLLQVFAPIAIAFLVVLPKSYFERIWTIAAYEKDESSMGRIEAWAAGVEMGLDNLFTGVGLKCFELPEVYNRYSHGIPRVAHNAYVQLFSETGLLALLSWLFLMFAGLIAAQTLARQRSSSETQIHARAITHSLALYLIGSVFLNAAYFEFPYIVLAVLVVLRKANRTVSSYAEGGRRAYDAHDALPPGDGPAAGYGGLRDSR